MKTVRNFLVIILVSLSVLGLVCSCHKDEHSANSSKTVNLASSSSTKDQNSTVDSSSATQDDNSDTSSTVGSESLDTSESKDVNDDLWTDNKK